MGSKRNIQEMDNCIYSGRGERLSGCANGGHRGILALYGGNIRAFGGLGPSFWESRIGPELGFGDWLMIAT